MTSEQHLLDLVRQEIINNNLQVKAIVQVSIDHRKSQ